MPVLDTQKLIDNRVEAIRAHHNSARLDKAQLDVSGGLDSAVMLGLLASAVGPDNITAVYSNINSSQESEDRAQEVADVFMTGLCKIDLTPIYENLVKKIRHSLKGAGFGSSLIQHRCEVDPTILGSIRSTLRAPVGRAFNRLSGGGIRHGTGNECEDRWLRFYQKGGDGEVDTNPLAMLSKGEVFQLGRALGVPRSILTAVPTPDLQGIGEAHNDEEELKDLSGVDWTYSKINPETGEYTKVGTIEAMSRVLDIEVDNYVESHLFCQISPPDEGEWRMIHDEAKYIHPAFKDFKTFQKFALSARHFEKVTRHKLNPNCPSLGGDGHARGSLLEIGILTNVLPRF